MSVGWLVAVYLGVGMVCAALIVGRHGPNVRAAASGAAAILVWPLWAPFALGRVSAPARAEEQRILEALGRARAAVAGTELDALLSERDVRAMKDEVARIARRLDAIEAELGVMRSERHAQRLRELRDADRAALEDVAELCELLASELALARYGRSEGIEPLVAELSARVEALAAS